MKVEDRPIGFFDSGVGGISVLKEAIDLLPKENFIYFGDSANAPYGTKTVDEVKDLTFKAVDFFMEKKIKALVVACNTATSAAIIDLRERYAKYMPIIGIEPALKPAVEYRRKGKILIMATPMTLAETKFNKLMNNYKNEAEIEPLPCPGLVELIERGEFEGEQVNSYLKDKVNTFGKDGIAAIVLGCTHYPFIKKELFKVIPRDVPVIDGSRGTAKQLKRQLTEYNILNKGNQKGSIEIYNSLNSDEIINLSRKLLGLMD
ncbi:glutamate racemase [Clostridium sp. CX1]|uniref:Glutamate racemase n=1 Tax=Clostridium tanneri TaxID=3037988 RepID=A0ABU4JU28_9CLOT|nr:MULTISPECIES: glutamate racemase [unclassified Clostridium]MCT8977517.1 glutamate racemase [Clostridium sp. CX1]MDW8801649.1 glutamate racemase [Clostridium sp. A1-XYC3]